MPEAKNVSQFMGNDRLKIVLPSPIFVGSALASEFQRWISVISPVSVSQPSTPSEVPPMALVVRKSMSTFAEEY